MAISLKHSIVIVIDETEYPLEVRRPTKKETKQIETMQKKELRKREGTEKERKAYLANVRKKKALEGELADNRELCSLESDAETKKELLVERRDLRKQIADVAAAIEAYVPEEASEVMDAVDVVAKARFDALVSGDGVEPLSALMEEYGMRYLDIWSVINERVAAAKEKN